MALREGGGGEQPPRAEVPLATRVGGSGHPPSTDPDPQEVLPRTSQRNPLGTVLGRRFPAPHVFGAGTQPLQCWHRSRPARLASEWASRRLHPEQGCHELSPPGPLHPPSPGTEGYATRSITLCPAVLAPAAPSAGHSPAAPQRWRLRVPREPQPSPWVLRGHGGSALGTGKGSERRCTEPARGDGCANALSGGRGGDSSGGGLQTQDLAPMSMSRAW